MNDTEFPSLMIGSRQVVLPWFFAFRSAEPRHRLHRRLVFAVEWLWIKQDARLFLRGDTTIEQKQEPGQHNAHDPLRQVRLKPDTTHRKPFICPATSQRRRRTDSDPTGVGGPTSSNVPLF